MIEFQRFLDAQGRNLADAPIYRLVWSDEQFELRKGTFNEFSGNLFLRQVIGVQRVPKYPYVKSRWILEKFFPPEVAYTDTLPESYSGSYEPLFVFQDREEKPLPITLLALEMLIAFDRKCERSDPADEKRLAELAETQEFEKILGEIDS